MTTKSQYKKSVTSLCKYWKTRLGKTVLVYNKNWQGIIGEGDQRKQFLDHDSSNVILYLKIYLMANFEKDNSAAISEMGRLNNMCGYTEIIEYLNSTKYPLYLKP